ncbi:hypothetical protein [Methylocystis echinoides]|uniref:hypothetical protein n=1 Tax=Methylocystis echinoides TaxID=29468 RepID=UPI003441BDFE
MTSKALAISVMLVSLIVFLEGASLLFYEALCAQEAYVIWPAIEQKTNFVTPGPETEELISKFRVFSSLPGTSGGARRMLQTLDELVSAAKRVEEVHPKEILKVEPTSGTKWLELAKLRAARFGSGSKATLSALEMSELTEPREMDAVVQRIVFYLLIWDALPEGRQRLALSELSDAVILMDVQAKQTIRSTIAAMDATSRQVIKQRLAPLHPGKNEWMKAIGL